MINWGNWWSHSKKLVDSQLFGRTHHWPSRSRVELAALQLLKCSHCMDLSRNKVHRYNPNPPVTVSKSKILNDIDMPFWGIPARFQTGANPTAWGVLVFDGQTLQLIKSQVHQFPRKEIQKPSSSTVHKWFREDSIATPKVWTKILLKRMINWKETGLFYFFLYDVFLWKILLWVASEMIL